MANFFLLPFAYPSLLAESDSIDIPSCCRPVDQLGALDCENFLETLRQSDPKSFNLFLQLKNPKERYDFLRKICRTHPPSHPKLSDVALGKLAGFP